MHHPKDISLFLLLCMFWDEEYGGAKLESVKRDNLLKLNQDMSLDSYG